MLLWLERRRKKRIPFGHNTKEYLGISMVQMTKTRKTMLKIAPAKINLIAISVQLNHSMMMMRKNKEKKLMKWMKINKDRGKRRLN
jgi:hypothetical protein